MQQKPFYYSLRSALLLAVLAIIAFESVNASWTWSQEEDAQSIDAADIQAIMNDQGEPGTEAVAPARSRIDLLSLIASGGKFMIPIGLMSLLVVTLAVERLVSLRQNKVLPKRLAEELEDLTEPIHKFNPAIAYEACLNNPSPAARVFGAMMLRTGQPLAEIERTAADTVQREADRYSSTIRWLNLAAAATPLMGLLGTVWGMIVAFHESTTLTADRSRSEQLSEGIYTALVTTLAGLIVAIPAAILAQYLENRVIKLFHQIEQLAFDLAPGLARFTGRQRMDVDGSMHAMEGGITAVANGAPLGNTVDPPSPPPAPPPRTSATSQQARGAKTE
ncbi:MotA/TolQ/ExbB proton channel family protein [Stieleria marina]|uniref:Colicin uptake protein TolQ n=1 Tax=Stieleria marina TaxID=1930275 RepID=A0A517NP95_9BACT|nr:colicin uptake protein TolQ [Planctomycetes bacterium K23_9]